MYMGVAGAKGESDAGASSPISIFGWSGRAKGGNTGRATGAAGAQGARFALLSGAEPWTTG